ncbi:hypothetical protein AN958_07397 [Leucoagaricus sp. SymC.cos]|nr:hypothetical protein AN958_07397 [Leucoagaricus sp. SymC.cos]
MYCPHAPRVHAAPLPGRDTITMMQSPSPSSTGTYPINLENVTIGQQIELEEITLTAPVHIHTPTAHVGLIYGSLPGQTMTSLDVVMFLRQLSQATIDRNVYAQLSPEVKVRVKAAFIQRRGSTALNTTVIWDDFMGGRNVSNGPIGRDLLSGATEVWGVENVSFGGFSVIHLA